MPVSGDRYDRFLVEDVLGQGGMATVYRVRHGTLGSLHALKVLDLPFPSIRARLVQEGQVQARLRHPHVVAVTDLIEVDGAPGLIMELVSGPTLEAWLHDSRPDAATAAAVFAGILDAVAYAHREGLIHRDLKPGNVLLQQVDGRVIPKVTDFGLAKLLTADAVNLRTRTGFAMGTPGYMAPEQVRSAKDVDARADVFALGCILYDLWCGARAFSGDDLFATLEAMEARRYTDPRTHRPDIPDAVVAALHGALEPDRERRIPSCEVLRAVLDGAPFVPSVTTSAAGVTAAPIPAAATIPAAPSALADSAAPGAQTWASPTLSLDEAPSSLAAWAAARQTLSLDPPDLPAPRSSARSTVLGLGVGLGALFAAAAAVVCAGGLWWAFGAAPRTVEAPGADVVATASPGEGAAAGGASGGGATGDGASGDGAAGSGPVEPAGGAPRAVGAAPSAPASSTAAPGTSTPSIGAPSIGAPSTAPSTTPAAAGREPVTPAVSTSASSPAASSPAAASPQGAPVPTAAAAAAKDPGRFVVRGTVDTAWLEAGGRRYGPGSVAPGAYTLHARWGTVEVERKVTVAAGQSLTAACDEAFFDCVVR